MNYYVLAGLFNGLVSFIFGAMVLLHDLKSKKYQTFAFLCLSIFFWGIFYFLWQSSGNPGDALFYCRLLMIGAILMPITHYHHVIEVFQLNSPRRTQILLGGYLFAVALISVSFTNLIAKGVSPKLIFPFWPDAGVLFGPLLVFKFSFASYTIFLLWGQAKKITGPNRTSLIWVIVATIIAYISGSTNYPLWYGIVVWPILTPLVCVFLITEAFFLFRLRLLDSYLFLRDTTIQISTSLIIAAGFYAATAFIPQKWELKTVIFGMALLLPLLYPIISAWVRRKINRTRWGDVDRYLEDIEDRTSALIGSSLTVSSLSNSVLELMTSIFPVGEAAVYFWRAKEQFLHLYAKKEMAKLPIDTNKNSNAIKFLEEKAQPVSRGEYSNQAEGIDGALSEYFDTGSCEVLAPIYDTSNQLCGLLAFGPKISLARFHRKDLEAIKLLSKKIGIAASQVMVSEQYTMKMEEWTHSLNYLTKPIGMGAGLLKTEALLGKLSPEGVIETAKIIESRASQLHEMHKAITSTFSTTRQALRGEYPTEKLNLSDLVRDYTKNYKIAGKSRVTCEVTGSVFVNANKTAIERVLLELLENAMRHTQHKGDEASILIKDALKNDNYEIAVIDNGDGIDPEKIENIWKSGWQEEAMNKGAAGLGLSICKQTIEVHGGKIYATSPGKDQGMTIGFLLSILKTNE